jgi:hypothetical protein
MSETQTRDSTALQIQSKTPIECILLAKYHLSFFRSLLSKLPFTKSQIDTLGIKPFSFQAKASPESAANLQ